MKKAVLSIGAGHGGHDCGIVSPSGIAEKEAALLLARRVKENLDACGAFDTLLLRSDDRYLSTEERARMVMQWGSRCHLELHFGRFCGIGGACTIYSSGSEQDESPALRFAQKNAEAFRGDFVTARSYGRSERYFRNSGSENYSGIIPLLWKSGIHAFLLECGMLDCAETCRQLTGGTGFSPAADGIVRVLCGIFGVQFPKQPPYPPEKISFHPVGEHLSLKSGLFQVRSAPSDDGDSLRIIRGGINVPCCGRENGFYKISPQSEEYLSRSAVLPCKTLPQFTPPPENAGLFRLKSGCFYVREKADSSSAVLAVAEGGQIYPAAEQPGWKLVSLGEKIGYIRDSAWESAAE